MITQNPSKLEQLVEFAEKGGIGTCVANQDIIANSEADLMFYTGEVITVLKHIKDDMYLGYCEGVIGTFKGKTVDFNGSLKNFRTTKSEKNGSSRSSSVDEYRQESPKSSDFLDPLNSVKELSSPPLSAGAILDKRSTSPTSPTINIIPDPSDNIKVIIPSPRKSSLSSLSSMSSLSSEHSIPKSPHKQNTMPQLSSNTEPTVLQRRNNTAPTISTSQERSINSNKQLNYINTSSVSNDKTIIFQKTFQSRPFLVNSKNQLKHSDPSFSRSNDQIITKNNQNSAAITANKQENIQNTSVERSRSPDINELNGPKIPGMSNSSILRHIGHIDTKSQRNEHHRSISNPNINRSYDSQSNSSGSSSPRSNYNKRHSLLSNSSTSPKSFQNKSQDQILNGTNGKNISPALQSRPPPGTNRSYQDYSDKINEQNLPPSNPQMQNLQQKYPTGVLQKSLIGRYSPSTTPLPSPRTPQVKVLQEEKMLLNDRDSPSTTPIPSPRFASKKMVDNNSNYESRAAATNTPAPTPIIVTPKITLQDSDLDDSDIDQEKSLISYRNDSMKPSSSSYDPPKSADVPTLKVDHTSYSRSGTPSDLSANDSEDISSDDDDESKIEVKNESETEETQSSKPAKKKKKQIIAIDEYGFVYDVSEEDIPPGTDTIQKIIQAPGAEEKTTRTIQLYREREAKWVALFGSIDPLMARDSRKVKKLVRSGIPESVRGKAWQFMACADKYRKAGVFDELRKKERLAIYDVIERDIHRCYPDHIQFHEKGFGQDDLHDVLKAYAHYNPAVGYCQGMGRLVGMMLMQMPVEDTFWLLVATIEEYMVGYFTPTLSQIRIDSIVFEQLLLEHDAKLAQHLSNNGVVPLMYMTQWFMTIFTMALPWASVLRVWDLFYFEGVKLFFRIGLAIIDCTKEHILKNCPTSSEILGFLLHIPHELLTPDLLLEAAFKIRLKRSTIRRLTKRANATEKNIEGSDTTSVNKETRRGLMKKSKSVDKLKIDGIEFKLVGE